MNNHMWWIEKKNGKLVTVGRLINVTGDLCDIGVPNPQRLKYYVRGLCREGEKPVKVKLVKVD